MDKSSIKLDYQLPATIESIRDGWQSTMQSAAVVSGLLAAVAAQFFSFFKENVNYDQAVGNWETVRDVVVGLCYFALFLNIGATISGFILIDGLGEIHYHAAASDDNLDSKGPKEGSTRKLLETYDGGKHWTWLAIHWLFTFSMGILALLILLVVFVYSQENRAMGGCSIGLCLFVLLPIAFLFSNGRRKGHRYRQLRPPVATSHRGLDGGLPVQTPDDYMMYGTPTEDVQAQAQIPLNHRSRQYSGHTPTAYSGGFHPAAMAGYDQVQA